MWAATLAHCRRCRAMATKDPAATGARSPPKGRSATRTPKPDRAAGGLRGPPNQITEGGHTSATTGRAASSTTVGQHHLRHDAAVPTSAVKRQAMFTPKVCIERSQKVSRSVDDPPVDPVCEAATVGHCLDTSGGALHHNEGRLPDGHHICGIAGASGRVTWAMMWSTVTPRPAARAFDAQRSHAVSAHHRRILEGHGGVVVAGKREGVQMVRCATNLCLKILVKNPLFAGTPRPAKRHGPNRCTRCRVFDYANRWSTLARSPSRPRNDIGSRVGPSRAHTHTHTPTSMNPEASCILIARHGLKLSPARLCRTHTQQNEQTERESVHAKRACEIAPEWFETTATRRVSLSRLQTTAASCF